MRSQYIPLYPQMSRSNRKSRWRKGKKTIKSTGKIIPTERILINLDNIRVHLYAVCMAKFHELIFNPSYSADLAYSEYGRMLKKNVDRKPLTMRSQKPIWNARKLKERNWEFRKEVC